MYEFFLRQRADEIRAEMLRDAEGRRLIREARAARASRRVQRSASTTLATTRTPSSMSDAVTCP